MMACKFTYNTVQSERGHSSIQLRKQNEDRNTLIMGRKYLDEYGQKILKLNVGKHKNELPPYIIRDKLHKKLSAMIDNGIVSLANDKFTSLEHEISSIIGDDDCFDLETKEIMDIIDDLNSDGQNNSPSTPETERTDNSCLENEVSKEEDKATVIVSPTPSNEMTTPLVKNDVLDEKDTGEEEVNDLTTEEETMEKSQHSGKSIDLESEGGKSECSSAVLDEVVNNKAISPSPIHKSFDFCDEQIQLIDVQCLPPEQKSMLKKLTTINLEGLDENEAIISIIEGNTLNKNDKRSRSYGFVSKLKNIAGGRSKKEDEGNEEYKNNKQNETSHELITKPQVTIEETEDVRKIYEKNYTKLEHVESKINYSERLNSLTLGRTLPKNDEDMIKNGIKFFFAVFVHMFSEPQPDGEHNYCPIEIVFRLWKAILRSERELYGIQTNKILQTFEAVAVGNDVDDYQICDFETLAGIDLNICNFIRTTMTDLGIIQTETRDQFYIQDDSSSAFTSTSIFLNGDPLAIERRTELTNNIFPGMDLKSPKWHDIIVRGCNEILNCDLSTQEIYNDPDPSNKLSIWYATRYLPYHITANGSYKDALNLLLDRKFTIHRMNSCGYASATTQHLNDLKSTIKLMLDNNCENSLKSDYTQAAVKAIHEQVLNILEERKKVVDDMLMRSRGISPEEAEVYKNEARDIGNAMHQLGVSFGKEGLHQKEIDVYSEALRLKEASSCPENEIADTLLSMSVCYRQLDNPLTALARLHEVLKIELKLHGEIHPNVGEVSHYKGLIHCEIEEFHEAHLCFQKTLRIQKSLNSPNGIVRTLCWIGQIQERMGDFHQALDSFQTALSSLEMIEDEEGLRHAEILQVRKRRKDEC